MPDFADLHQQRQLHPHLTQQLLWEEYRRANPDGYRYSRFCELSQRWRCKQDGVLRQEHKAGEKLFVDWAGTTIPIYDPRGGPVQQAHLFVDVLGASSYTAKTGVTKACRYDPDLNPTYQTNKRQDDRRRDGCGSRAPCHGIYGPNLEPGRR